MFLKGTQHETDETDETTGIHGKPLDHAGIRSGYPAEKVSKDPASARAVPSTVASSVEQQGLVSGRNNDKFIECLKRSLKIKKISDV